MKRLLLLAALACPFWVHGQSSSVPATSASAAEDAEYRASAILVEDRKLAEEIIAKLRKGGDFAELARLHSKEPSSKDKGGDLGWSKLGDYIPAFAEAVRRLSPKEYTREPVRTEFGWFVVLLTDKMLPGERERRKAAGKRDERDRMLQAIKFLSEQSASHAFVELPPASPASLPAPPEATDYKGAYQTAGGCIFFYTKTDATRATHAEWKGPPCKGKAVAGQGTLRITASDVRRDGTRGWVQHHMQGTFVNGLLTGEGEKVNYSYNAQKVPDTDAYGFAGQFKGGLLHGAGRRIWVGPAGEHPRAIELNGTFADGVPDGFMTQIRSRPVPGAIGDVVPLVYGPEGLYVEQAAHQRTDVVTGHVFFDNGMWDLKFAQWRQGMPKPLRLVRNDINGDHALIAQCSEWRFEAAAWQCGEGELIFQAYPQADQLYAGKTAFSIATGAGVPPLRVTSNPAVGVNAPPGERPMRCDPEWTACSGRAQVWLSGSGIWWDGEAEYRRGELRPQGRGRFMEDDKVLLDCSRLASPVECAQGTRTFNGGNRLEGRFRLVNVGFETEPGRPAPSYRVTDQVQIAPEGWARLTFTNDRWADVRMRDGKIVSVGDCDDPSVSEKVTCSVEDGGTRVVYNFERRARADAPREREARWEAPAPRRERFVPIPIPSRQPMILPGMR